MKLNEAEKAVSTALFGSLFRGLLDFFTPTTFPLQPLPFDLVTDDCPIISTCPIFRLPVELHSIILHQLDRNDLANLALVDQDCRQLARSVQFTTLHLSVSQPSLQLMSQVFNETVVDIKRTGKRARRMSLCVRRLVVGSGYQHVRDVVGEGVTRADGERMRLVVTMYDALISMLCACLPRSFPNLELFHYADSVSMHPDLILSLSRVHLRHLAVDSFGIKGLRCREQTLQQLQDVLDVSAWSDMRTLSVVVADDITHSDFVEDRVTERVLAIFLRAVAPSIEGLKLGFSNRQSRAFSTSLPEFPQLQRLHLQGCRMETIDTILCTILPNHSPGQRNLQSLQLDCIDCGHLAQLGQLPKLTRLVINDYHYGLKDRRSNFAFLMTNPQLELLSFTFPIDPRTLIDTLLPGIHSYGFTSLRTLRLASASTHFSKRVIAAIGLIESLEMLWLSAGQQVGWRHDWFIDHSALKSGLKGLRKLRELAFTRDSYHCEYYRNVEHERVRFNYYSLPLLPPNVHESSVVTPVDEAHLHELLSLPRDESLVMRQVYIWEKWHREKMRALASEYAGLFHSLEFIFLGEYPMEIAPRDGQDPGPRSIRMLSNCRELFLTKLNRKWGTQTV